MMTRFYKARWIIPVTSPEIESGFVEVAEGGVVSLHQSLPAGTPFIDLGDVALLPGLVNAHTHLEFSALEAPVGNPDAAFDHWISEVIAYRRAVADDPSFCLSSAVKAGLSEQIASGVVAVGEITTDWQLTDIYAQAASEVVSFREVINYSSQSVEQVTADVEAYLMASQRAGVSAGVSPHAPYTVHWQQLLELCRLSAEYRVPCAMHLAETREECQLIDSGQGVLRDMLERLDMWEDSALGDSPELLAYARMLATCWRALIVHGNYLPTRVIQYLGTVRDSVTVCYCPRTHAWFRHDRYPLQELLENDVRVCLGTDSRASNPDLSLIREMKWVAATYPGLTEWQLLEMVTVNGAFALGLEQRYGFIGAQASARLLAVPVDPQRPLAGQVVENLQQAELRDL